MPVVPRLVQEDVPLETLNAELLSFAQQVREQARTVLSLSKPDGTEGEQVFEGDFLVPTPPVLQSHPIQPGTMVLVLHAIPPIGLFHAAFHTVDCKVATALLPSRQFVEKHIE